MITLVSGISWVLSLYGLYLWDRVPAAESPHYFPDMTSEDVQAHTDWQTTLLRAGFSLAGYALYFLIARLIADVSLFLVSFQLMSGYKNHFMAILMAILLSVFAAAGIWGNPLFGSTVAMAPWMNTPSQFLSGLLWCGAIVVFTFPDGKFSLRWIIRLAALLIPLTFLSAFGSGRHISLCTRRFLGAKAVPALVCDRSLPPGRDLLCQPVSHRYLLFTGRLSSIPGNAAALKYVLLNEPIWFACETFFAVGLARSVFRDQLLEEGLE